MEIGISYRKAVDGKIKVTIQIREKRDCPTSFIFANHNDFPTKSNFKLPSRLGGEDTKNCVIHVLADHKEALFWAQEQICALEKHLAAWRCVKVPTDCVIEI